MLMTTRLMLMLAGVACLSGGCRYHDWVELSTKRYTAALKTGLPDYTGRKIAMLDVVNKYGKSNGNNYYSTDGHFSYYVQNDQTLMRFYKNALAKAFTSAGMTVYGIKKLDKRYPNLRFYIRAISETTLKLSLKVIVGKKVKYKRVYVVKMARLPWNQRAAQGGSERKAYRFINKLAEKVLNDPKFAKLVAGTKARPAGASPIPPVPPRGCTKDTDCKGNRICEDGACISDDQYKP